MPPSDQGVGLAGEPLYHRLFTHMEQGEVEVLIAAARQMWTDFEPTPTAFIEWMVFLNDLDFMHALKALRRMKKQGEKPAPRTLRNMIHLMKVEQQSKDNGQIVKFTSTGTILKGV